MIILIPVTFPHSKKDLITGKIILISLGYIFFGYMENVTSKLNLLNCKKLIVCKLEFNNLVIPKV